MLPLVPTRVSFVPLLPTRTRTLVRGYEYVVFSCRGLATRPFFRSLSTRTTSRSTSFPSPRSPDDNIAQASLGPGGKPGPFGNLLLSTSLLVATGASIYYFKHSVQGDSSLSSAESPERRTTAPGLPTSTPSTDQHSPRNDQFPIVVIGGGIIGSTIAGNLASKIGSTHAPGGRSVSGDKRVLPSVVNLSADHPISSSWGESRSLHFTMDDALYREMNHYNLISYAEADACRAKEVRQELREEGFVLSGGGGDAVPGSTAGRRSPEGPSRSGPASEVPTGEGAGTEADGTTLLNEKIKDRLLNEKILTRQGRVLVGPVEVIDELKSALDRDQACTIVRFPLHDRADEPRGEKSVLTEADVVSRMSRFIDVQSDHGGTAPAPQPKSTTGALFSPDAYAINAYNVLDFRRAFVESHEGAMRVANCRVMKIDRGRKKVYFRSEEEFDPAVFDREPDSEVAGRSSPDSSDGGSPTGALYSIRYSKLVLAAGSWTNQLLEHAVLPGTGHLSGVKVGYIDQALSAHEGGVFPLGAEPEKTELLCERRLRKAQSIVRKFMPTVDADAVEMWMRCLYQRTPDGEFIVDSIEGVEARTPDPTILSTDFVLAAGFNGHGFQHAPAIAELVRYILLGEEGFSSWGGEVSGDTSGPRASCVTHCEGALDVGLARRMRERFRLSGRFREE